MNDAYKLLKYMIYGATFEHMIQHTHRMVCTRAEIEHYAEQTFDNVLIFLTKDATTGKFSDFQCNIAIEASRIFKANKDGIVEFKKKDIGYIA